MTCVVGLIFLQFHDVAALGRADQPGAHVRVFLGETADVARIVVVVNHFVRISHVVLPLS
jgi:hypothetical protein